MIYKDIIPKDSLLGNIPSFPRYHVTTEGEVYSLKNKGWQKLKLIKNIDGYLVAYLSNEKHSSKHHFVHRLVLTVFKGEPPPNMERRRIRKKWQKNSKNFRTLPDENFYQYEDKIICHPLMARRLRKTLQKEQTNVDPQIHMPKNF